MDSSELKIDWEGTLSYYFINPKFSSDVKRKLFSILNRIPNFQYHIFLCTSGSSEKFLDKFKWVALSKDAILYSAKHVNDLLDSHSSDVWLNVLPSFHIGGLSIYARAYLSHSKVVDFLSQIGSWNVHQFLNLVRDHKATLTSMVPTQVYDLVCNRLESPKSLRAVFVGGAAIAPDLYEKAVDLGWKLLPTYGMTESSSQIATGSFELMGHSFKRNLKVLPHMEIKVDHEDVVWIKSPALFSGYAVEREGVSYFIDPKIDGWFCTEDVAELNQNNLILKGRRGHVVKVCGEKVNLAHIEELLYKFCIEEKYIDGSIPLMSIIAALPHERLGHEIVLITELSEKCACKIASRVNHQLLGYEKIKSIYKAKKIATSPLGKPLRNVMIEQIRTSQLQKIIFKSYS